jgi:NADH dehydrogenase FAD-containing subunit
VDVRLNTRVGEVGARSLLVKVKGTGEEAPLDYGLCVWCAGTEPQPFTANLLDKLPGSARAEDGRVVVDRWLRVEGAGKVGSVMVLGDAAYVLDRAEPLPQTAQVRPCLARETARLREVALPPRAHVCARAAAARRSRKARPQGAAHRAAPRVIAARAGLEQVAGQQGAYVARLINRDYDLAKTPPRRTAQASAPRPAGPPAPAPAPAPARRAERAVFGRRSTFRRRTPSGGS